MYIIYIVYIYKRHMISPTGSCFCSFGFSC